jgi:hypothetical protein
MSKETMTYDVRNPGPSLGRNSIAFYPILL